MSSKSSVHQSIGTFCLPLSVNVFFVSLVIVYSTDKRLLYDIINTFPVSGILVNN